MLAQDGSEAHGENSAKQAKWTRSGSAAAVGTAMSSSMGHDELEEYGRRIDITASLLVLNAEACSLDPSVPKLTPKNAALWGGLAGMEGKAKEKAMRSVKYEREKLSKALQSVAWEVTALGSGYADSPAAQSPEPPGILNIAQAKWTRSGSAAAVGTAISSSMGHDELEEYGWRIDTTASLLVLNSSLKWRLVPFGALHQLSSLAALPAA
jgi:hypothetical protein